jgi:hypothetical protein
MPAEPVCSAAKLSRSSGVNHIPILSIKRQSNAAKAEEASHHAQWASQPPWSGI